MTTSERFQCSATTLSSFELFAPLSSTERESIAQCMSARAYRRNQFVIRTDDVDTDVYFVISGTLRACAYSEEGRQVQFEDLHAGAMFGEITAVAGGSRSTDCFAIDDAMVAGLPGDQLRALIYQYPSIADAVLLRLAKLARRQVQRVIEFSSTSVRQRIRLELLRLASSGTSGTEGEIVFEKVPTHADLAARISTHREAVSREVKSLEASGVITWRPGAHVIHDVGRLTESASESG